MAMNENGNAAALVGLSDAERRARDLGNRIAVEAEAWKVAQLAATLCGGAHAIGRGIDAVASVRMAAFILAESRRQAAALETDRDGR